MNKILNKSVYLFFSFISFFFFPYIVNAASVNVKMSDSTVIVGNNITVTIKLNGIDDPESSLRSFGGDLDFDSNLLDLVSCEGKDFSSNGKRIAYLALDGKGITSGTICTCTFKTKAVGSTKIGIKGVNASNSSTNMSVNLSNASITIKDKPSSNNLLSNLSVSAGAINFNSNTTSYNLSVGASVANVDVSATAQDSKSKVSGTGTQTLKYGNNNISVTVTAEDGSTKTYTIKITRQDDRSGNNNLSKLSVNTGKLSPSFDKKTTSYKMEVPYSVSKIDVTATAEDSKAKVSISSPNLTAETTTKVTVTVTAENGSTKTYTIDVARGKDPNKKLSSNNYLSSLSVDVGMLSPKFDKEKTNYAVYLPYEVDKINISVQVEDTKYATIEKEGNSNLTIGNNIFKFNVKAEDESVRTYTVTVVRNKSLDEIDTSSSNTYLKNIILENGSITGKFDKEKKVYYYKKKNNKVDVTKAEPELEENIVNVYKEKNSFIIIVETPAGERGFYLLVEKSSSILPIVLAFIIGAGVGVVGTKVYLDKKKKK